MSFKIHHIKGEQGDKGDNPNRIYGSLYSDTCDVSKDLTLINNFKIIGDNQDVELNENSIILNKVGIYHISVFIDATNYIVLESSININSIIFGNIFRTTFFSLYYSKTTTDNDIIQVYSSIKNENSKINCLYLNINNID